MPVVSLTISALTILVLAVVALSFVARGAQAPVHDVPLLASSLIAWGGGFLHAFSASASALRRDRTEGVRHLFVSRTTSLRGYILARVGGLAALLSIVVGGGTLLIGTVAILAATRGHTVLKTAHATFAAVLFSVAFAVVVAPIAFAALGARSRVSGYFFLLMILVLPETLTWALSSGVPSEVLELCAIPSALAALRSSLSPGSVDLFRCVRALIALGVFVAIGLFFVRRDVVLLERAEEPS